MMGLAPTWPISAAVLALWLLWPVCAGIRDGIRDAFADGRRHYNVSNWRLMWWLLTGGKRDA